MSVLQVANLEFEASGNNKIYYTAPNTVSYRVAGQQVFTANATYLVIAPGGVTTLLSNTTTCIVSPGGANAIVATTTNLTLGTGGVDKISANTTTITLHPNGSVLIPTGTTAQREAAPAEGMFRYNIDVDQFEGYANGVWGAIGGGATLTDDTSTNGTRYVAFANATSGDVADLYVSSTKLYFNPSTGQLSATDFNSLSDAAMKTDITNISGALEMINSISGVKFKWKDSGTDGAGVLAQEVQKIFPEIVTEDMHVKYSGVIALLVQCVKELKSELDELKNK